jgi:hypothetical protein
VDLLLLVLPVLADAVVASPAALVWFAGTALLAVAAAEPTPPQPPAAESGSPGPGVATAGSRDPTAR